MKNSKLMSRTQQVRRISPILASLITGAALSSTPVLAQDLVLEEIVVTAQKREQNLRDVAATVNVVSGDTIQDLNILNFEDLERVTSGVQLLRPNPRNVTISIRGIYFDPESGSLSAVDVYQNGITQRADNLFGALFDVSNVEVLRGPQGSLQGATSPAGAIIINTQRPGMDELGGYAQVTYSGGTNGFNAQGAFDLPLIENKLGLRIAAYSDQNDLTNVTNLRTGRDQDSDTTAYRISLAWEPTENLSFDLVYQDLDQFLYGSPQIEGSRDQAQAFAGVPGIPCAFLSAASQELCVTLGRDDRAAFSANDAFTNRKAEITTLNANWQLSDNHSLAYVFGYTDSSKVSRTENDKSSAVDLQTDFYTFGLGIVNDTDYLTHQGTTTVVDAEAHELRFASNDNPFWNYMVGAYWRDQDTTTAFEAWSTSARYIPLPAISPFFTSGEIEGANFSTGGSIPVNNETMALFTAHSFQLSEATSLEVAYRRQRNKGFRKSDILFGEWNQLENTTITSAGVPQFILDLTFDGLLGNIESTFIEGIPLDQQATKQYASTGSLSVRHDFNDSFSGYIAYNRSYRQGGISVNPGETLPVTDQLYDEETSDAIELGAKMVFLDGRAEVNAVIYHQMFDGYQGFVRELDYVNAAGVVEDLTGGLVFNGDAITTGVELDWRMLASESLVLGGTFSYSQAEFDDALIPCNDRVGTEVLGRCASSGRIPGSSELQASIFAEFSRPIGEEQEFFIRTNAKYSDGILATRAVEFGMDPGETDSYILADLFLGIGGERWEISAFAKNIFDEDADLDLRNPGDANFDVNGNFTELLLLPERSYGLTVRVGF